LFAAGDCPPEFEPFIALPPDIISEADDGRLRLLFVSHSFPPPEAPWRNIGGMQRAAQELYDTLSRRADLEVAGILLKASWRWSHLRVVPFMTKLLWRLPQIIAEERIDAVLFSSVLTALPLVAMRRRLEGSRACLAAVAHGLDVTMPLKVYQRSVNKVFRNLDLVVSVSRATARECRRRGLPARKRFVIHNGIDTARFTPPPDRQAARQALLNAFPHLRNVIAEPALLLGSAGRLIRRKGVEWFVSQVMPRLPGIWRDSESWRWKQDCADCRCLPRASKDFRMRSPRAPTGDCFSRETPSSLNVRSGIIMIIAANCGPLPTGRLNTPGATLPGKPSAKSMPRFSGHSKPDIHNPAFRTASSPSAKTRRKTFFSKEKWEQVSWRNSLPPCWLRKP